MITSIGAPQSCVSLPILYFLYTNDCTSSSTNNYIITFSDDSAILRLLHADSDISMYTSEIESFVHWCDNNHFKLNVSKTQEIIFYYFMLNVLLPITCLLLSMVKKVPRSVSTNT